MISVNSSSSYPFRGDFVQLSAPDSVPQAVVPNLYLHLASPL